MKQAYIVVVVFVAVYSGLAMADPSFRSPCALAVTDTGHRIYVADYTAQHLIVVDLQSEEVMTRIDLPVAPTGVALSPDGSRLYVTGGVPNGQVLVYATDGLGLVNTFDSGHSPVSPVCSPDGSRVYICNQFGDEVWVLDTATGTQVAEIPVSREPIASALTPDGSRLVVGHHLPAGTADDAYSACVVSVIATAESRVIAEVPLPNGSNGLKGLCLSPDGRYAYGTHVLARYQLPTTQLERGWMNTNALSIIDLTSNTLLATVLLDNVDRGAANPWGVTCTDDGHYLCITQAGTHELSVIDRGALHTRLDRVAAGEQVNAVSHTLDDVPTDLTFLLDIRDRILLPGTGPRALVASSGKVIVGQYFSGDLAVVTLDEAKRHATHTLALGPDIPPTPTRLGEMYFHDAALCFQQWQSCTSCHPDMRSDSLNWDLLNDGMGNPKNSKSMLLSHVTPPVMISGIRPDAETAVRAGIKYIQFAVRPEEDAQAIDTFLRSLTPVPSPQPLDDAVHRGETVFQQAGCATCHSGSLYTDQQLYNVGTGLGRETDMKYDTPALVEIWRTAPYLHDGRAATLTEVVGKHNQDNRHGKTSTLTDQEREDLVAFLRSR